MYAFRTTWLDHEAEAHRKVWRCFEHTDLFLSQKALRHHLEIAHPEFQDAHTSGLVDLGHATVRDERNVCPFCLFTGPFYKGLANHMAFHMEKLATFAVPRIAEDGDDECSTRDISNGAQRDQSAGSLKSILLNFSSTESQGFVSSATESVASRTGKSQSTDIVLLGILANIHHKSSRTARANKICYRCF